VKSRSMVEWGTSEGGPSRRSSRNFGVQRRAWHHLLRANPDEHDPLKARGTSALSSPSRQTSGPRTRLPKSNSMKSVGDSVKSDIASASSKAAVPQHARTAPKVSAFDGSKRSHKKLAANPVQPSKKPCHLLPSHPASESPVTAEAATMPLQSAVTYTFTENGLVPDDRQPSPELSFLSYR